VAPTLREIGGATRADSAELARNPRARSAVLRVAERLP
jgi:16S rRNA (cytosine1402-N4)-methyltransferase